MAFDIDGCLIRGGNVLKPAREALKRVTELGVPHVYLTNGGGMSEADKAEQLREWMGVPVEPEHVVLSHSPMRALAEKYGDRRVLVIGTSGIVDVARNCGFKRAVAASHIVRSDPSVWPFTYVNQPGHGLRLPPMDGAEGVRAEDVEAVMVFHDGLDWGLELQVACDVLRSGVERDGRQTPLYCSNGDLLWSNEQAAPRFGQGAFRACLERLWGDLTGRELEFTMYGKPTAATYEYARRQLERQADGRGGELTHLYGFGDNEHSDIRGANRNGWHSVLVRTGVFDGGENSEIEPAHLVCDHVGDVVAHVLELHGAAKL